MKLLSAIAALIATGLVMLAGHSYRFAHQTKSELGSPAGVVVVEAAEQDVGERPLGKTQITFRLRNPSEHAAEVINLPETCGFTCCLKHGLSFPQPLPPGGSLDIACELLITAPGPFDFSNDLYLNDNGLRSVKLTVQGVGVAPGGKADDPARKP
jgi:hypothetical protein